MDVIGNLGKRVPPRSPDPATARCPMATPAIADMSGAWVRQVRTQAGYTQEELARAIGVTVSTVNRWETGHVRPQKIARRALLAWARERGLA
jgi:DNA-binding transcriptional regulator YiaG